MLQRREPEDPHRQRHQPQRHRRLVDGDRARGVGRAEEERLPRLGAGLGGGGVERVGPAGRAEAPQVEQRGGGQQARAAPGGPTPGPRRPRQSRVRVRRRRRSVGWSSAGRPRRAAAAGGAVVVVSMDTTRVGRAGATVWCVCRLPVSQRRGSRRRAGRPRSGCCPGARVDGRRSAVRLRDRLRPATGRGPAPPDSRVREESPRVKRSKAVPASSAGRPGPSSCDGEHGRGRRPRRTPTVTVVPGGVCRRALLSRLVTTWCSRCSSPVTTTGSSGRSSCHRWSGADDAGVADGLEQPAGSGRPRRGPAGGPASRRASSSRSSTRRTSGSASASTLVIAEDERLRVVGGVRRLSSAYPWMVVSGVRSSWEASATNWRTCCSLRCRSSRACSTWASRVFRAEPTWPTSVALVGELVGHPHRRADLAAGQRQGGHRVGGVGDLAQRPELAADQQRPGDRGDADRRPARAAASSQTRLPTARRPGPWWTGRRPRRCRRRRVTA